MEFQASAVDMRGDSSTAHRQVPENARTEADFLITAGPRQRVVDLAAALVAALDGSRSDARLGRSQPPDLWLDDIRLDPAAALADSGIRAGARLGLGGPPPGATAARNGGGSPRRNAPGRDIHGAATVAELRVVGGPDTGLVVPLAPGTYVIGREGDIVLTEPNVSRQHARIAVTAAGTEIMPLPSTNGTGLDGVALRTGQVATVRSGQIIAAGRDLLTVTPAATGDTIPIEADPRDPFWFSVNRPPRTPAAAPAPIVIDLGGGQPAVREQPQPWVALLLAPALAAAVGVMIAWFSHQWLFLLFSVGGVAGTLGTQLYSRRSAKARSRQAALTAQDVAAAGGERLGSAIEAEERRLRDALPDPGQVLRIAAGPGTRLWERRPRDTDFLRLRVGIGDLPASTVSVRGAGPHGAGAPGPEGHGPGDHGPGLDGLRPDPVARNVPVPVDLAALGVLGIAGPAEASQASLAWMIAQIATLHGPSDVRMALLTDQPRAWRWTRWLPHLQPLDDAPGRLSAGVDPASADELAASLRHLIDQRLAAADGRSGLPSRRGGHPRGGFGSQATSGMGGPGGGVNAGKPQPQSALPAVVVIVDGAYRLRRLADLGKLIADGPAAGVYVICRDDDWRALPGDCRGLLHADPAMGGTGGYREQDVEVRLARLDTVTGPWADEIARALAPIKDVTVTRQAAALPQSVRLLDLWGVGHPDAATVSALWRQGGRATVVPIGRTVSGTFTLDLVHDGPHFLLGGFTGSGKSEFLRTLVASLAMGNTPDELTLALIDYKGGAGFARFEPLPHVTGYLTDLDEYGGVRALAALGAEIRYRLSLLSKAGCESIEDYIASGRPLGPLPRLVIVIDEFRNLAEQMPEFLPGLIDVAARGRSVGMHLVLATQRPNGVVKQDLLANIGLRLCLRVQDPADSIAIVDIPDAAAISQDQRGRGYARSGHGIAVPFQAGYVRGTPPTRAPDGDRAVQATPWPFGMTVLSDSPSPAFTDDPPRDPTDLDAIVRAVQDAGWRRPSRLAWLPPLPERIALRELPTVRPTADGLPPVAYGLEDLPSRQAQRVLAFDLEHDAHLLVGGAPRSGRTTTLRTVAARIATLFSPSDVHLYVLDCGAGGLSALADLPHCGAVVRSADSERAARLLDRLAAEVTRRLELLAEAGFDSVTEQRAKGPDRLPYMVLLLDRLEGFAEDLGNYDGGRLPGVLARLLSEGASAGLRVLATGDKAALTRQASSYPARLVLRLADPGDYTTAGVPRGAMPATPCPGRGVLLPAGTAVQVAFASPDTDAGLRDASGTAQARALDAIISAARDASPRPSPAPLRVAPLPSRISLIEARTLPWALPGQGGMVSRGGEGSGPLRPVVGVGGDDLSFLGIDLDRFSGFLICGPLMSGRTTALLVIAESLLAAGTAVVVLTPKASALEKLDGRNGVLEVFRSASPDRKKLLSYLTAVEGPLVVLADDAEALYGQPVEGLLAEVAIDGRGRSKALVAAGTTDSVARAVQRSFTTAIRQSRSGLLLTPEAAQQGRDLFGVQLPRSAVFDHPKGRGYLIQAGGATLVQVPEVS